MNNALQRIRKLGIPVRVTSQPLKHPDEDADADAERMPTRSGSPSVTDRLT